MKKQLLSIIAGIFLMNTSFAQLSLNYTKTDVICYGDANGAIQLSITGGVQPYTVNWTSGSTATSLNGLNPGVYVVMVADAIGTTMERAITIDGPTEPLTITAAVKNASAGVSQDGAIDLTVSGGSPFYTNDTYNYVWSNGQTSEDLDQLNPGVYSVIVIDQNNCTAEKNFTVLKVTTTVKKGVSSPTMLLPESNGAGAMIFRTETEDYQLSETVVYNMDNGQFIPVNSEEGMVELNNLAPGKYLISARTADGEKVSRIFMVQ